MDDIIKITEQLYREANPDGNMNVPSYAYEQVEASNKRRIAAGSPISLYDWCKLEQLGGDSPGVELTSGNIRFEGVSDSLKGNYTKTPDGFLISSGPFDSGHVLHWVEEVGPIKPEAIDTTRFKNTGDRFIGLSIPGETVPVRPLSQRLMHLGDFPGSLDQESTDPVEKLPDPKTPPLE